MANEAYATQIARDWNTRDQASGFTCYVFSVPEEFLARYLLPTAGAHIEGSIETIAVSLAQS